MPTMLVEIAASRWPPASEPVATALMLSFGTPGPVLSKLAVKGQRERATDRCANDIPSRLQSDSTCAATGSKWDRHPKGGASVRSQAGRHGLIRCTACVTGRRGPRVQRRALGCEHRITLCFARLR